MSSEWRVLARRLLEERGREEAILDSLIDFIYPIEGLSYQVTSNYIHSQLIININYNYSGHRGFTQNNTGHAHFTLTINSHQMVTVSAYINNSSTNYIEL